MTFLNRTYFDQFVTKDNLHIEQESATWQKFFDSLDTFLSSINKQLHEGDHLEETLKAGEAVHPDTLSKIGRIEIFHFIQSHCDSDANEPLRLIVTGTTQFHSSAGTPPFVAKLLVAR